MAGKHRDWNLGWPTWRIEITPTQESNLMQEEEQIDRSKPPTIRTGYSFRGRVQGGPWAHQPVSMCALAVPAGLVQALGSLWSTPEWSTKLYSLERKFRILAPRTGCDPNWCTHMRALEGSALKLCHCSEPKHSPTHHWSESYGDTGIVFAKATAQKKNQACYQTDLQLHTWSH